MSVADPQCLLRLERPISGVDHVRLVEPRLLAQAHHTIDTVAARLGVDSLNDFYASSRYGSYKVKWSHAIDGLKTVRAVKQFLLAHPTDVTTGSEKNRTEVLSLLDGLERVLDDADTREIRFCVVGNY